MTVAFTKDDAMAFVLAAREAEQPEDFEALAENLVSTVWAIEQKHMQMVSDIRTGVYQRIGAIPLRDRPRKEPRKPWFGRGNRPNTPPFLWTRHNEGYERFWASATATAAIIFSALIVPFYMGFALLFPTLMYHHGLASPGPLFVTLWLACISGIITGSIAARPPQ